MRYIPGLILSQNVMYINEQLQIVMFAMFKLVAIATIKSFNTTPFHSGWVKYEPYCETRPHRERLAQNSLTHLIPSFAWTIGQRLRVCIGTRLVNVLYFWDIGFKWNCKTKPIIYIKENLSVTTRLLTELKAQFIYLETMITLCYFVHVLSNA